MYQFEEKIINGSPIVYAEFEGALDLEISKRFSDEMEKVAGDNPGFNLLIDLTNIVEYKFDVADIRALAAHLEGYDTRTGRTAFVSGPSISRMLTLKLLTVLINTFRGNSDKAFESIDDAIDWLTSPES